MRILLVRPPVPPHTIGLKHIMICEPLELEYVAAGLGDHEVEIVDLMMSLSVIRHGVITRKMLNEAQKAGRSYLREYLPDVLPLRRANG